MQNGSHKQRKTSSSLSDLRAREAFTLKQLLKRRQNARLACAFDEAIPSCYLKRAAYTASPIIHVSQEQKLSPYVIHLGSSHPTLTPSEELADAILINLLTHPVAISPFATQKEDLLTLTPQDTQRFFLESQLTNAPKKNTTAFPLAKPNFFNRPIPSQGYIPASIQTPFVKAQLFAHPKPPQDIFSYFDLPDTEEEENESELVDLVSLQQEVSETLHVVEDPVQKIPIAFPRWSRRAFSLPWIRLPQGWSRAMAAFLLVSFATVLPIHAMSVVKEIEKTKTQILSLGAQGLSSLTQGTEAAFQMDSKTAERSFSKAVSRFDEAQTSLQNLGVGMELFSAVPGTQAHTAASIAVAADVHVDADRAARDAEGDRVFAARRDRNAGAELKGPPGCILARARERLLIQQLPGDPLARVEAHGPRRRVRLLHQPHSAEESGFAHRKGLPPFFVGEHRRRAIDVGLIRTGDHRGKSDRIAVRIRSRDNIAVFHSLEGVGHRRGAECRRQVAILPKRKRASQQRCAKHGHSRELSSVPGHGSTTSIP